LFQIYKDQRVDAETFQEFCLRHSNEELTGYLLSLDVGQSVKNSTDSLIAASAGDRC